MREPFFECVLVSDRNEYHFHIRAWTPADAEVAFTDELRADGVTSSGELWVLDAKGRPARWAPFRGKNPEPAATG